MILRDVTERVEAKSLLARSEARLRGILDSAMDAIITVDERQHIVLFNAAAEAMFGCPREEAIGAPLAWFIPERFRGAHGEHVARFGETGTASRRMGALRVVTGLRRNGEEFPIDASISQLDEDGGKFYTVILRDVTERVRAEEALRALARRSCASSARPRTPRASRRRAASRASCTTSWRRRSPRCRWTSPGASETVAGRPAGDGRRSSPRWQALLDGTVAATRRIAADLRPLMLDDLGLVPGRRMAGGELHRSATGFRASSPSTTPSSSCRARTRPRSSASCRSRSPTSRKHAQASRVEVAIERDGDGADAQHPRRRPRILAAGSAQAQLLRPARPARARVRCWAATVAITARPAQGTHVEVRLPLAPPAAPS